MGCVWERTEHWLPRYARLKVGEQKGGKTVGRYHFLHSLKAPLDSSHSVDSTYQG